MSKPSRVRRIQIAAYERTDADRLHIKEWQEGDPSPFVEALRRALVAFATEWIPKHLDTTRQEASEAAWRYAYEYMPQNPAILVAIGKMHPELGEGWLGVESDEMPFSEHVWYEATLVTFLHLSQLCDDHIPGFKDLPPDGGWGKLFGPYKG